jgi:flagellar protein FliO/FliZ
MKIRSLIIGIYCGALSMPSHAEEPLKTLNTLPSSPAYLIKLVLGLVVVLMLFAALAWLVRRFGLGGFTNSSTGELSVLESLSLGSRERLVIVQIGQEKLLLGITAGQINKLHTLETVQKYKTKFKDHLKQQQAQS